MSFSSARPQPPPAMSQQYTAQTAIQIAGHAGKYPHINGVYERASTDHNGHAVWILRSAMPSYVFHTGKARWVISTRLDDGARCFTFLKDEPPSQNPADCKGKWQTAPNWDPESGMSCVKVDASTDKFVKLRMSLEDEMSRYGLVQTGDLKQLWKRLDYNGNNVVSLAEVDKLVTEMVAGGAWPSWLDSKPALMRAFQKAIRFNPDGRADYIEKSEFHCLLLNIFWFGKLFEIFEKIDKDMDRRIDLQEFQQGCTELELQLTPAEAQKEFESIDTNSGGQILFVEFCAYIRKRVNPDCNPAFDADIISGEKAGSQLRKKFGNHATRDQVVTRKTNSQFDSVADKLKEAINEPSHYKLRKMWNTVDFNGNGKVSLAEIDKWVVEQYPLLNHKPALMRAYKSTISVEGGGDGDDWVEKKEFVKLLGNLVYFNKLFWLFSSEDDDNDRRLDLNEFRKMAAITGLNFKNKMEAQEEFHKIAKGGNHILFSQFCELTSSKNCPEAMKTWLG